MKISRIVRFYYIRLKRLQGNPRYLAGGIAVGVFVGLTPTLPVQTLLIVVFSYFARSSVLAALISSWIVCNPLTFLPLYYCCAVIGNLLTPYSIHPGTIEITVLAMQNTPGIWPALQVLGNLGFEALVILLAGGLAIAIPCGMLSYWPAHYFFKRVRPQRNMRGETGLLKKSGVAEK